MSQNLDDFLAGYAAAMVWANAYVSADPEFGQDGETVPQGDGGPEVIAERQDAETWFAVLTDEDGQHVDHQIIDLTDARAFYADNLHLLTATGQTDFGQHGHDFALTRNGHGAGFWDRGYGTAGDILTERAQVYGEATIIF